MEPARRLRAKVARGEVTSGVLAIHQAWPELVEICERAGLDYLIVCMEHGAIGTSEVAEICLAGRRAGFPVLVRPRANDYTNLRHAMDLGPVGFLLAAIESTADLDIARDAILLPPRGRRRPGGLGCRWVSDMSLASWQREVEEDFIVLPQIETRRGLENVRAIADHPLTTAVAVGPYDLSAELGVCGRMDDPALQSALASIQTAARAAGKTGWMFGDGATLVRAGWHFVCLGEPTWLMEDMLRAKAASAKAARKE